MTPDPKDDPRQANEEGDPRESGRLRGRPAEMQDEQDADRTNPDAAAPGGKKDVSATTPHRESGDRA